MEQEIMEQEKQSWYNGWINFLRNPSGPVIFAVVLIILNYKFWIILFSETYFLEKIFWVEHFISWQKLACNVFISFAVSIFYPLVIGVIKLCADRISSIVSNDQYINRYKKLKKEQEEIRKFLLEDLYKEKRRLQNTIFTQRSEEEINKIDKNIEEEEKKDFVLKVKDDIEAFRNIIRSNKSEIFVVIMKQLQSHLNSLFQSEALTFEVFLDITQHISIRKNDATFQEFKGTVTLKQMLFILIDSSKDEIDAYSAYCFNFVIESNILLNSNIFKEIQNFTDEQLKTHFAEEIKYFASISGVKSKENLNLMKERVKQNAGNKYDILENKKGDEYKSLFPYHTMALFIRETGEFTKAGKLIIEELRRQV